MIRSLARLKTNLEDAARGLGFDDKLEKPLEDRATGGSTAVHSRLGLRFAEASDGDALSVLRLEVTVLLADAPALKVVRRTFWRSLNAARSVPTNDAALDALALLETHEPVRVRAAFKAGLGDVVRELLAAHPEATLEARSGALVLGVEARQGCLERTIDLATRAARALEVARIKPVEKDSVLRCGFCHADLARGDEQADLLVKCDRCAASVHAACWDDHEGCPALGCSGAAR